MVLRFGGAEDPRIVAIRCVGDTLGEDESGGGGKVVTEGKKGTVKCTTMSPQ